MYISYMMDKIGNIVCANKTKYSNLFNVVNDYSCIDNNLPTLIVGWSLAKKTFGNISILEHTINKNIFWCFGVREKREQHESFIKFYTDYCVNNKLKTIEYKFIDVFSCDISEKEHFYDVISGKNGPIKAYVKNNFLYVHIVGDCFVYGISLDDISYEGKDPNKIINVIKSSSKNIVITETNSFLSKMFSNNSYMVPCMC